MGYKKIKIKMGTNEMRLQSVRSLLAVYNNNKTGSDTWRVPACVLYTTLQPKKKKKIKSSRLINKFFFLIIYEHAHLEVENILVSSMDCTGQLLNYCCYA